MRDDLKAAKAPTDLLAGVNLADLLSTASDQLVDGWSLGQAQDRLPGFVLHEEIGRGGMGIVYRATDRSSGETVAVKLLRPSVAREPRMRLRLLQEASALRALDHPGILKLRWPVVGSTAGEPSYLVMDYVEGESLATILERGPVAPDMALRIFRELCDSLQYAHGRGVLHRDIKPANILIGQNGRAMLLDFGIAKAEDGQFTRSRVGDYACTPTYAAPEVLKGGEASRASDLFSLGLTLFEMLTGFLPSGRPRPPSEVCEVSPGVDEVVFRALEREPGKRYPSVDALVAALDEQVATLGKIRRRLAYGSAAFFLLLMVAAVVYFREGDQESRASVSTPQNVSEVKGTAPTSNPAATGPLKPEAAAYLPGVKVTPVMEEFGRVLVNHQWFYFDSLWPPGDEFRFAPSGRWHRHRDWTYWIEAPGVVRIQYFDPVYKPGVAVVLTFDSDWKTFGGEFTDGKGNHHVLKGNRLHAVSSGQ